MVRVLAVLVVLTLSVPMTAAAQTPSAPPPAAPAPAQAPPAQAPPAPAAAPAIETGSMVQIEYTLSDDAGKLIDSNKGQPPLTYTQGDRQLMAALENQLVGLRAGQEKKVVLKPDEAFGLDRSVGADRGAEGGAAARVARRRRPAHGAHRHR